MSLLRKSLISLCLIGTTFSGTIGFTATPTQASQEPESKVSQCKRLVHAINSYNSIFATQEGDARNGGSMTARSNAGLQQFKSRRFSDPKIRQLHQKTSNLNSTLHNYVVSVEQAAKRKDAEALKQILVKIEAVRPSADRLDRELQAYCGAHIQK